MTWADGRARPPARRRVGRRDHEAVRWRMRSTFDRYNIIDEADLAAAVAKRFRNGKQAANIEPYTIAPDSVTSSRTGSWVRSSFGRAPVSQDGRSSTATPDSVTSSRSSS